MQGKPVFSELKFNGVRSRLIMQLCRNLHHNTQRIDWQELMVHAEYVLDDKMIAREVRDRVLVATSDLQVQ